MIDEPPANPFIDPRPENRDQEPILPPVAAILAANPPMKPERRIIVSYHMRCAIKAFSRVLSWPIRVISNVLQQLYQTVHRIAYKQFTPAAYR